jgi:hypothetical protein
MRVLATILFFLAATALPTPTPAEVASLPDNPYSPIINRNVFGLNPTPSATAQPETTAEDIIRPNGIMSIFGQLQVLFKVASPGKAGQPPREVFYILGKGQQQDDIAVVNIDPAANRATFNNHGAIQEIALPNAEQTGLPQLAANADAPVEPFPRPAGIGMIGTGRMPPYLGGSEENAGQGPLAPLTQEQQIVMIEAQRAYYKSHNDPRARSLPPTALTPPDAYDPPPESP